MEKRFDVHLFIMMKMILKTLCLELRAVSCGCIISNLYMKFECLQRNTFQFVPRSACSIQFVRTLRDGIKVYYFLSVVKTSTIIKHNNKKNFYDLYEKWNQQIYFST